MKTIRFAVTLCMLGKFDFKCFSATCGIRTCATSMTSVRPSVCNIGIVITLCNKRWKEAHDRIGLVTIFVTKFTNLADHIFSDRMEFQTDCKIEFRFQTIKLNESAIMCEKLTFNPKFKTLECVVTNVYSRCRRSLLMFFN